MNRAFLLRCEACRLWRTQDGPKWWDWDDRCIRRMPDVYAACCGHGRTQGYLLGDRGVIRFPGDVHPFLVRAAARRFLRSGIVPGFARQDDENFPGHIVTLGCRFPTELDRHYRRWPKRRRRTAPASLTREAPDPR